MLLALALLLAPTSPHPFEDSDASRHAQLEAYAEAHCAKVDLEGGLKPAHIKALCAPPAALADPDKSQGDHLVLFDGEAREVRRRYLESRGRLVIFYSLIGIASEGTDHMVVTGGSMGKDHVYTQVARIEVSKGGYLFLQHHDGAAKIVDLGPLSESKVSAPYVQGAAWSGARLVVFGTDPEEGGPSTVAVFDQRGRALLELQRPFYTIGGSEFFAVAKVGVIPGADVLFMYSAVPAEMWGGAPEARCAFEVIELSGAKRSRKVSKRLPDGTCLGQDLDDLEVALKIRGSTFDDIDIIYAK